MNDAAQEGSGCDHDRISTDLASISADDTSDPACHIDKHIVHRRFSNLQAIGFCEQGSNGKAVKPTVCLDAGTLNGSPF